MKSLKVLSLCDGMGCGLLAFKTLGIEVEYHAVEIDMYARKLCDHNQDVIRWTNDVTLITKEDIKFQGPFDWVIFGSPFQTVSSCGDGSGLLGKSGLLIDCLKVLRWCQEFNPNLKFLIENVKMKKHFLEQFNEHIGVKPILINSSLVSGQNRERYYWCNFDVRLPEDKKILAESVLEDGVIDRDKSYCIDANYFKGSNPEQYFNKARRQLVFGWSKSTRYVDTKGKIHSTKAYDRISKIEERLNLSEKVNTLTTGPGCWNQSTRNAVLEPLGFRKLTVRECARLQTIPETFDFSCISNNQGYKCIGNGWTVDIISHIIKESGGIVC